MKKLPGVLSVPVNQAFQKLELKSEIKLKLPLLSIGALFLKAKINKYKQIVDEHEHCFYLNIYIKITI
jgi:hypothetical protein